MNSFYNEQELRNLKFKKIGTNVKISKKASIYSPEQIEIGNNVRVDDFCLLSGNISIKDDVHISAYTALYGGGRIEIGNFSGCSPRCTLISASDDFSGEHLIGAVIDNKFTNVTKGEIILKDYVQLGTNTVVLPNVTIAEGTVTGAMTLVNKNLDEWGIYFGIPAKKFKERSKKILEKVKEYNNGI